jgi:hypothetical protein
MSKKLTLPGDTVLPVIVGGVHGSAAEHAGDSAGLQEILHFNLDAVDMKATKKEPVIKACMT